ncbi:hypothetical protein ACFWIY_06850 [Streptomyces sioyaensis]|uniref:hypothetical protein n=1 Tax=Streptomyces sioyaensis TaxID=67364 RepID=UPI00364A2196
MKKELRDWFISKERAFRNSVVDPSARKTRLYLWTIGVTLFSLMAVCWPLITDSGDKSPARIFGGVEFLLAGIVIMVGGVTDLLSSAANWRPRAQSLTVLVSVLLGSSSLGFSARLANLGAHTPPGDYLTLSVALFVLTVSCGTYAVWLAERGE